MSADPNNGDTDGGGISDGDDPRPLVDHSGICFPIAAKDSKSGYMFVYRHFYTPTCGYIYVSKPIS